MHKVKLGIKIVTVSGKVIEKERECEIPEEWEEITKIEYLVGQQHLLENQVLKQYMTTDSPDSPGPHNKKQETKGETKMGEKLKDAFMIFFAAAMVLTAGKVLLKLMIWAWR